MAANNDDLNGIQSRKENLGAEERQSKISKHCGERGVITTFHGKAQEVCGESSNIFKNALVMTK